MKIKLFLIAFLFLQLISFAQQRQLSSDSEISVLTIGPGTLLNDSFGHNAFRIKDDTFKIDLVFNYGVYDFKAPNFYLKFARGKLNYLMDADPYEDFYTIYSRQDRTIQEQILNLSLSEKQQLFEFLLNNYKPENRYYLYDFFYDNCATKMRDVVEEALNQKVIFNNPDGFEGKTFRALIHDHVERNSWGGFGIDVALGSVIDKKASPYEHMFLPKYIYEFFDVASLDNSQPLVKETKILYQKKGKIDSINLLSSPLVIFGLLSILIISITFFDKKKLRRTKWLDLVLFVFTGLIGVMLLLLWFATDHTATANNYNMLWAFPLNLIAILQLIRKQVKNWFVKYLKFIIILLVLLSLHWIIGVQIYAIGLIPLLIALFIRYSYLIKYYTARLK